jgi:hypothetical protein
MGLCGTRAPRRVSRPTALTLAINMKINGDRAVSFIAICFMTLLAAFFIDFLIVNPVVTIHQTTKLIKTADHESLLAACREMMTHYDEYRNDDAIGFSNDKVLRDNGEIQKSFVPEIILNMKPLFIMVRTNRVVVRLNTYFSRVGFIGYAENAPEDGTQMITNGLWWYNGHMKSEK